MRGVRGKKMNKLLIILFCGMVASSAIAGSRDPIQKEIKGQEIEKFISKYTDAEINEIDKGKYISITVLNSKNPERIFFSVQLVLVKPKGSADVFQWLAGDCTNANIKAIMNITDQEIQSSYILFFENIPESETSNEVVSIHSSIRLDELVRVISKKKKP
jgi:hypothetical protein